mmetsp:Transcript_1081/g.3294  ORF Transcript_1081/g.3294 Transcript_1081/m.3294 type:complete len:222 (-) Transcript_1081:2120-2785(-)
MPPATLEQPYQSMSLTEESMGAGMSSVATSSISTLEGTEAPSSGTASWVGSPVPLADGSAGAGCASFFGSSFLGAGAGLLRMGSATRRRVSSFFLMSADSSTGSSCFFTCFCSSTFCCSHASVLSASSITFCLSAASMWANLASLPAALALYTLAVVSRLATAVLRTPSSTYRISMGSPLDLRSASFSWYTLLGWSSPSSYSQSSISVRRDDRASLTESGA